MANGPCARTRHPCAPMTEPPPVPGVIHEDGDIPGVRVSVALAGAEAAPALVLLHGWPQHWWAWPDVTPALAETHRVIARDRRGWGWSSVPGSGYEKEQLATDLLALLDAIGLQRVGVAGGDSGGWGAVLAAPRGAG